MEVKYFTLQDGSLELDSDKLKFTDKFKRNRTWQIISFVCGVSYAMSCIVRNFKEHDKSLLWFGLILLPVWLIIGYNLTKVTTQSDVQFSNISEIILRTLLTGKISAKIILKSKKVRPFVLETENGQDLEFINLMKNRNIPVTEKRNRI